MTSSLHTSYFSEIIIAEDYSTAIARATSPSPFLGACLIHIFSCLLANSQLECPEPWSLVLYPSTRSSPGAFRRPGETRSNSYCYMAVRLSWCSFRALLQPRNPRQQ